MKIIILLRACVVVSEILELTRICLLSNLCSNSKLIVKQWFLCYIYSGEIWHESKRYHRKTDIGTGMGNDKPKVITCDNSTQIQNILSDIQLTQSETNLLPRGLNFCPTPPPPAKHDINKDIDAFARRLTLKEYHTPENIEEIIDGPGYQPSILQKLNQKERKIYTRPSR